MKTFKTMLMLMLALVLATGAVAEDAKKGEKGKPAAAKKGEARKGAERKAPTATSRFLGKIELSAEQKEKVAAIDKEFAEKFAEFRKAQDSILTKEQVDARAAAMKKARESKDPEARKAVQSAVKLSDEQKAKMAELGKSQKEVNDKILAALKQVLTEEQQKELPQLGRRADGKGKPAAGKKPAGDKKKKDAAK
ncbi:MAG: hypothetical protein O3B13_04080 [Planctomycetota bacterium]|nr:hypothetical protein [Planctomycetota bacterium]